MTPASTATDRTPRTITFGPLFIRYDAGVLRPRGWTEAQGRWGGELLPRLPEGPVLEIGAGAGQIGLHAVHGRDRRLVMVDASSEACRWAAHNAAANGIDAEVRHAPVEEALSPDERFALVLADPPWVPHDEIQRFPEDPPSAIDGGADGLAIARDWVTLVARHLAPGGALLLQLGTDQQADALRRTHRAAGLREHGRLVVPGRGVVVCLRPS